MPSLTKLHETSDFGILLKDIAIVPSGVALLDPSTTRFTLEIMLDNIKETAGQGSADQTQDKTRYLCRYLSCNPATLKLRLEAYTYDAPDEDPYPPEPEDEASQEDPPTDIGATGGEDAQESNEPESDDAADEEDDSPEGDEVANDGDDPGGDDNEGYHEPDDEEKHGRYIPDPPALWDDEPRDPEKPWWRVDFSVRDFFQTVSDTKDIILHMSPLNTRDSRLPPLQLSAKCIIFPILYASEEFYDPLAPNWTGSVEELSPINISEIGDPAHKLFGGLIGEGMKHYERWKILRNLNDLEASVRYFQEVLNLVQLDEVGKDVRQQLMCNACNIQAELFLNGGDRSHIDTAISILESEFDKLRIYGRNEGVFYDAIGACRNARFIRTGNLEDMEVALGKASEAITMVPWGDFLKAIVLGNHAIARLTRFNYTGNLQDVTFAISCLQSAIDDTIERDTSQLPRRHANLGDGFMRRFERLGDLSDIDDAIKALETALRLVPDDEVEKPRVLTKLGAAYALRFKHFDKIEDSDAAIEHHKAAVHRISDDDPFMAKCLNNLGNAVRDRVELSKTADPSTIYDAINALDDASLRIAEKDPPSKPAYLRDLGAAFKIRFDTWKNPSDIGDAVTNLRQAVNLIPETNQLKLGYWLELAEALLLCAGGASDSKEHQEAVQIIQMVAANDDATAKTRFKAYAILGDVSRERSPKDALQHYQKAIDLLHLVAWIGLSVDGRHHALAEAGPVVCRAAAHAFSVGEVDIAVSMLEGGRSVVWGQLGHHRLLLDELETKRPNLAKKVRKAADSLSRSKDDGDWDDLVKRVRKVRGFERFFKPLTMDDIRKWQHGREGAIVIVNVSQLRCDACIITHPNPEAVIHLQLPEFSYDHALRLQGSMKMAAERGFRDDGGDDYANNQPTVNEKPPEPKLDYVLEELWDRVVKPVLERLGITVSVPYMSDPTRIWWCPTGPLTSLPLHAAGIYKPNSLSPRLSDFAVSSYIPTITTLVRSEVKGPYRKPRILAVASPNAPGLSPIKGTEIELGHIEEFARQSGVPVTCLTGPKAVEKTVLEAMEFFDWVHFACHGLQSTSPDRSALYLASGDLNLMEIIRKDMPNARFAFLSACQTAKGDAKLSEEAVHISAGMLQAGYRAVIGTMWSIPDSETPQLVKAFYERLLKKSKPEVKDTARCLWEVIREAQDTMPLHHWVPFIHFGGA